MDVPKILYNEAENMTTEWAKEIRTSKSIDSLLIFSRARAAAIIQVLEAIEKLKS